MSHLSIALFPVALFLLVASLTPGPNNLLLMRSGATFGVRRSAGHLAGIQLGCIGLLLLSWLGVGAVLLAVPGVFAVLRWACFAYLMWLAVVIFMEGQAKADAARSPSAAPLAAPAASRPMRWHEACVFQLINPKAWMMSITLASAFYGNNSPDAADITVAALSWVAVGTPSMFVWVVWGASIDRVLKRPLERRVYAWVMSLAVAATAVWMLR